ncbi:hypothetical protein [Faecalibaculum rodentium]|uniref:hypothetical protein n=1 Tax=Faecalibaculum rodentium TaxID=1702221 RepID=UPI003F4D1805
MQMWAPDRVGWSRGMGQAAESQEPEAMTRPIPLQEAVKGLRLEIRKLERELDLAQARNRAEVDRLKYQLRIRRDSLANWLHLQDVFQRIWDDEEGDFDNEI